MGWKLGLGSGYKEPCLQEKNMSLLQGDVEAPKDLTRGQEGGGVCVDKKKMKPLEKVRNLQGYRA